jgi:hypothetical protein
MTSGSNLLLGNLPNGEQRLGRPDEDRPFHLRRDARRRLYLHFDLDIDTGRQVE